MSAWYLFSAMGFYPVAPGSDEYQLGSPLVKAAVLQLENGRAFTIRAVNQSEKNVYVSKIELNGKVFNGYTLKHADITAGGELVFYMNGK